MGILDIFGTFRHFMRDETRLKTDGQLEAIGENYGDRLQSRKLVHFQ